MDSSAPLFHNPPSRPVPSNLQPAQPLLPASSQPAQQHQQRNSISHPINVSWLFPRNVLAPSPDTPSPLLTHPDGITPVDLLDLLGVSCKNYPTGRAPSSSGFIGGFPVAKIARQNAPPKEQLDSTDVPLHENTKKPPETNENSAIAPEQPSAAYPPKETAALIGNGADASTHGREEIELAEAISGDDRAASSGFDDGTPEENSSSGNDNRALSQRNRFIRLPNGVEIRGDSDEATYGNLGLSSCPGKKVRLDTGPVGGRAVINRDLGTDFARLKSVGVVCVVCCLNDAELSFLGAPPDKYLQAAKSNGIQVLRLPIIEGSCPETHDAMEAVIEVMDTVLRRGSNVLVHCRGGVGRAGLVACCLLLWKGFVTDATRAVQVVRIRRSLKAIETMRQEDFIAGFENFLKAKRGGRRE